MWLPRRRGASTVRPAWSIPLHLKLLATYLVVAACVFAPSYIYLKTAFHKELRQTRLRDLEAESSALGEQLAAVPLKQRDELIALILGTVPARVTILDPRGRVLADSRTSGELENHSNRPEIKEALAKGTGSAERLSETTKDVMIYAAQRFPAEGPAQGVVRLALPTRAIDDAFERGFIFFTRAGAVAFSAAVLLSLLAALLISRPLKQLARTARAFTEGDLGHPIEVTSHDEIGDVATALGELAANLRGTLIAAGADRATLQALLDDLPCGVIIYDQECEPRIVSGPARVLCGFSGSDDLERARQLAELPGQAEAIARVLEERRGDTLDLDLPWLPNRHLQARWVSLHAANGDPQPALVVRDLEVEERSRRMQVALQLCIETLRKAARAVGQELAAELERTADDARSVTMSSSADEIAFESVELGKLCETAISGLKGRIEAMGLRVELDLSSPSVRVLEADGRSHHAVRRLVVGALAAMSGTNALRVRGEIGDSSVRLNVRAEGRKIKVGGLAELVHCFGGDAGSERVGDDSEAWLVLPRA